MDKKIYVHIGPHKTGTTTIQVGLKVNENFLRDNKVLCPKTGRVSQSSAGNHNLAWELLYPLIESFDSKFGTWKDFHKELKKSREVEKVIISSEDFSSFDVTQINHLREILKDFDIKIIIYLRRQDKILQSTWVEVVKNAWTKVNVESFFDWLTNNKYSATTTNYLQIIKDWGSVFSKENLILKIFDPSQFKGSLLEDFLFLCDIKHSGIEIPHNANVSPGVKTIEAIRLVKGSLNFSEFNKVDWNFIVDCIVKFGDKKGWNKTKINYLDKELSEKIMSHHKESNKIIANEYFQKDYLFIEEDVNNKATSSFFFDDFTRGENIELFSYLLSKLDHKLSHPQ